MNISDLAGRWRAALPGKSAAAFWGSLALLLLLAGIPLVLLALTAPQSKAERQVETGRLAAAARNMGAVTSPSAGASLPGVDEAAPTSPGPEASAGLTPQSSRAGQPEYRSAAPVEAAKTARADFEIECWPTLLVVPGGSTTINCNVPVFNGDGSEISLVCRVEGMTCGMSPDKVRTQSGNRTLAATLTVTAPDSAPVGVRKAVAIAGGGETGVAVQAGRGGPQCPAAVHG